MRPRRALLALSMVALSAVALSSQPVAAQESATQEVTIEVRSITVLKISGTPVATAFVSVQAAQTAIVDVLTDANERFFGRPFGTGTLRQEDSVALLGVQAARIAARFASRIYEPHPDDRRAGALAVKRQVDRVLLNDEWL